MGTQYVYDFSEGGGLGRELLGGKGIGLAEMTAIGLPVPTGFTVTTEACREYMRLGGKSPDGLAAEVAEAVARLEERAGNRFGDPADVREVPPHPQPRELRSIPILIDYIERRRRRSVVIPEGGQRRPVQSRQVNTFLRPHRERPGDAHRRRARRAGCCHLLVNSRCGLLPPRQRRWRPALAAGRRQRAAARGEGVG